MCRFCGLGGDDDDELNINPPTYVDLAARFWVLVLGLCGLCGAVPGAGLGVLLGCASGCARSRKCCAF